ncbi:MAG: hypothetical protein OXI41_01715 [Chloroflexota bacterium]|nr:hypothetical protein [Chloroflexota bacterium]MDE2894205.1 hypothetical protein [Chloroflexota bacterium]
MGQLAEAISARLQQGRQERDAQAGGVEREPDVLVGTIGFVAGADHCIAFNEDDAAEIEQADVPIWGIRFTVLTTDRVAMAKARGASYASCTIDEAQADAALDPEFDIVVRLLDTDMDEATLRALARFGPTALAPAPQFPLSLRDGANMQRLQMLTGIPLAILCPIDVSASDLEILRNAGLGCMLLARGATSEDVAAVKQKIARLPARAVE